MAKKKEEVKENEELQEEVVTETTEKVEEPKTEEITSTGETEEVELAGDKIEAPLNEDAKVQATENKVPTVKKFLGINMTQRLFIMLEILLF